MKDGSDVAVDMSVGVAVGEDVAVDLGVGVGVADSIKLRLNVRAWTQCDTKGSCPR